MKTNDLAAVAGYRCAQEEYPDSEIRAGFTSDLLSDVMANAPQDSVLITIQAHRNTVAVATLAGIRAIVVCSDRPVPQDMLDSAKDEGIAVFVTGENQFAASARISRLLAGR